MKIRETIQRECCEPRDLKKYRGMLKCKDGQFLDLRFCRHCGELWSLEPRRAPGGADLHFVRLFDKK